jgi:hypothetical protein
MRRSGADPKLAELLEKPMKSLKLWSLGVGLAVGMGCSRASKNPLDASNRILTSPELAESRQEIPFAPKPSPCIKWANGVGRLSKQPRKAKNATVPREPHNKLQAKTENQPHI